MAAEQSRLAPLDGVRAFAVSAVILFHAQTSWAVGGYFGVDVFFVLSGYLITSLLLGEWRRTGRIALPAFWVRRARRLLPALFLMLAVVGVGAVLVPAVLGSPGLLGDTTATVGYVANWHLIEAHADYFAGVSNPSPLLHTWTLAIEEQFYLVWPPLLLLLVRGRRRARHGATGDAASEADPVGALGAAANDADPRASDEERDRRRRLVVVGVVAAAGAVASAVWMAVLTPTSVLTSAAAATVNRAYYGSDTRAQALLIGAVLAAACLWWGPVRTERGRRALFVAGFAGAAGVVVMWRMQTEGSVLTFHGGFALLALGTAAVIAAVTQTPLHPLARALSVRPLPYVGRISYGMYLWYLPVLVVMSAGRTHLSGVALLAARTAVIVALAAVSYRLLETPIRLGALAGWRSWVAVPTTAVGISLVPLLVPTATATVPAPRFPPQPARALTTGVDPSPPVRILVVGDSVAGSLGVGMSLVAARYGAEVVNRGAPGCSLAEGSQVRVLWYVDPPGAPCEVDQPQSVLDAYQTLVTQFDPDVVVYMARSDTLDTLLDGSWQHLGEPSFDQWAESRYQQAIGTLGSGAAPVVFLTSPFYDSGEQSDGQPWPENSPARVVTENRLLNEAARSDPVQASVIDLGSLLSPGGTYATDIDNLPVRCGDGVHLTVAGGEWVGSFLLPRLVALGRVHADSPAVATRPALPPQVPPWWFAKLPCGS